MITVFNKLERENLLKFKGSLLDLGCGIGKVVEPFFKYGYETTLVDKDSDVLLQAQENLKKIRNDGLNTLITPIEDFKFDKLYDGIIISNVLPFQKDKENISKIIKTAFEHLNEGGFLFFSLFGTKDQWSEERRDTMTFHSKNETLSILKENPYFVSEDYGTGRTMSGGMKTWHVFYLLYIK